ncbi:MAG: flagellar basal body-associated FliL family protein [Rhizobium sp.]|nr:flagellar basal body-associated FliL family protein [Rhizobium sp.]
MVKILAAGLWVCLVTLGAVYFSVHMATAPAEVSEEDARKAKLELVRGEAITIPMIADGSVRGYFLGRISFMMDKEKIKGVELPLTELMTDELFTLLIGNRMVDISNMAAFDVAAFREKIKTDINAHLGEGFVEEVLIEQLDYMSKDDVRATGEGTAKPPAEPVKVIEGDAVGEAAKPAH